MVKERYYFEHFSAVDQPSDTFRNPRRPVADRFPSSTLKCKTIVNLKSGTCCVALVILDEDLEMIKVTVIVYAKD